jgi:hypothetical protein
VAKFIRPTFPVVDILAVAPIGVLVDNITIQRTGVRRVNCKVVVVVIILAVAVAVPNASVRTVAAAALIFVVLTNCRFGLSVVKNEDKVRGQLTSVSIGVK